MTSEVSEDQDLLPRAAGGVEPPLQAAIEP